MTTPRPLSSNRPVYSCIRCSERKVKCDREDPCSACRRHNVECTFRPARLSRKKQKLEDRKALLDRVQHYEAFLNRQDLGPDHLASRSEAGRPSKSPSTSWPALSSVASESNDSISGNPVCSDREPHFVDNLMTRMVEEFPDAQDDARNSSPEDSDGTRSEDDFDLTMGSSPRGRSRYTHPAVGKIYELWQIFTENVDPLTKIVHVPSLRLALDVATKDIYRIPKGLNALMFAIYSTAVLSLTETDCQMRFGQSRSRLLSHYVAATKMALARANIPNSTNVVVLQALALHILSIRDRYSPRSMWTLAGVARRLAEGIGLHRDANFLGLEPFEAEIRRRIWCYLMMHDNRTAEMCGLPTFQGLDADVNITRPLANVNDDDISPGMQTRPSESSKLTDMVFCAVQSEFFAFAGRMAAINRAQQQQQGGRDFVADIFATKESLMPDDKAIECLEEHLETNYLRYCDPSNPLHLTTMLFTRYSLNVCRFMARHPRKWKSREQMPQSERQCVWAVSVKLLQQLDMMQSSPHLQRFAWNFAHYLQWSALVYVLDSLRADPLLPDATDAWRVVERTFHNNPMLIGDPERALYVAVGALCLKAFGARETAMAEAEAGERHPVPVLVPQVPDFIHKLRQRREAARMRGQARRGLATRSKQEPRIPPQVDDAGEKTAPNAVASTLPGHVDSNDSVSQVPSPPSQAFKQGLASETNAYAYWLVDDSNNTAISSASNSLLDTMPNLMLFQDQSINDVTTAEAIDWTQWDAWLRGTDFSNEDNQCTF